MVETLLDTKALWLSDNGPDCDVVIATSGTVERNLSDFLFVQCCPTDDLKSIETRILAAFDKVPELVQGHYCPLDSLQRAEKRFLVEGHLLPDGLEGSSEGRGILVSIDQTLRILINGENHLSFQISLPGFQTSAVLAHLNTIDKSLGSILDYSFDKELGFVTSSLGQVGTALRAMAMMHLPALTSNLEIPSLRSDAKENGCRLQSLFSGQTETAGDFYSLSNVSTLGQSEEEIFFHIRHTADRFAQRERQARNEALATEKYVIEDRVQRALGIAQSARLLELPEAIILLSSLRFGVVSGLLTDYSLNTVNELLLEAGDAHLELRWGIEFDEMKLNAERASLFRARFS